jgi:hypothetical protein
MPSLAVYDDTIEAQNPRDQALKDYAAVFFAFARGEESRFTVCIYEDKARMAGCRPEDLAAVHNTFRA